MSCCTFCGNSLPDIKSWPHQCVLCGKFLYNSPKPVVALVIPAYSPNSNTTRGLLIIKRGIEPYKGVWAFPGGYIDYQESWQNAAVREAREEIGVELDPKHLRLDRIETTPNNYIVFFVRAYLDVGDKGWTTHDITKNINDSGVQEILKIGLATDLIELGIPSHNRYMQDLDFRTLQLRSH
jgi:ADP-ribose pyrophosphatase YjhB (NUDIX family)